MQANVMDMYHPGLNRGAGATELTKLEELKLIAQANAHAYRGLDETTSYREIVRPVSAGNHCALFHVASQVEHSCHPNLFSDSESGVMKYIAKRKVASGDRLCISYIGCTLEEPKEQRHSELMQDQGVCMPL